MSRSSNIPENLILPLFQQWEGGKTGAQMLEWLKTEHNVDSSISSVNKRIKAYREAALQSKIATVRENASEQALSYASMLDNNILELNKKINKLIKSDDKEDILLADKLMNTQKGLVQAQYGSMIMEKPEKEEQDQELMAENLINKLGKLN
jgi:hypothetical protein